jgi:hypothetical protein
LDAAFSKKPHPKPARARGLRSALFVFLFSLSFFMGFHPTPHQGAHTLEPVCFCVRDVETGAEQTIVSNRIHPYFVQTGRLVPAASEGHVYAGRLKNGHWVNVADLQAGGSLA